MNIPNQVNSQAKELRISTVDKNGNSKPDHVFFEFFKNGELDYGAVAYDLNENGEISKVDNSFDMDGDGDADRADRQVLMQIAELFLRMQWFQTKELRISTSDKDGNSKPDTVYFEFYENGELSYAAVAYDKDEDGKIDSLDNSFDMDGDNDADDSDKEVLVQMAEPYLRMAW
jgi:hypothetical protein